MTKIIVEICQNHKGDKDIIKKMILEAARNGADIVKMQSIFSDDVRKRDRFEEGMVDESGKQTVIKRPYQEEVDRLSKLDLTIEDHNFFIEECLRWGVIPMTTIFARGRIKEIGELNWFRKMVKVASYDCASKPMLRELARYFDYFIISTGGMYDNEIEETAKLMKDLGKDFVFLHCVTSYPNTLDMSHLSRMEWLRQFTSQVGWSDHTKVEDSDLIASKVAIMLGADYIERHFTILPPDQTKDGPVSITPKLLRELSEFRALSKGQQRMEIEKEMPNWKILLGVPTREMTDTELLNRDYYRGRFASKNASGEWVDNWEDKSI